MGESVKGQKKKNEESSVAVQETTQSIHPPVGEPVPASLKATTAADVQSKIENDRSFREMWFPGIPDRLWDNWRWQMSNRIRSLDAFRTYGGEACEDYDHTGPALALPMAITPHYASLIDPHDPHDQLRRTVVPTMKETIVSPGESQDPLCESSQSPVPSIVHRYPNRVLFFVTPSCASYCRYCTRSRVVGHGLGTAESRKESWLNGIRYVEEHTDIRDVLISGGDPLTLNDSNIEWLLLRLRAIRHVEIIRIGTKVPVVLPQRITPALCKLLKKFHPLWINIHFAHPRELSPATRQACGRLADAGIPLGSQSVLLAGTNDDASVLKKLFEGLVRIRVRPYYLYQCDPVIGSAHFRTPVEKGLQLMRQLQGFTSGCAVPRFVIDAPGGGGKIPIEYNPIENREKGKITLRNYKRQLFTYPDNQTDEEIINGSL